MEIQNFQNASILAKQQKDGNAESKANRELGHTYILNILNNQIQLAILHYEKALEIAREGGYKQKETYAYLGLGEAYKLNNQIQRAIQHYEKAFEIAREGGYKQEGTKHILG